VATAARELRHTVMMNWW